MTHYTSLGIGTGDIGGAVAEAIIHDIRVNLLGIDGFPQIHVLPREKSGKFDVALRWGELMTSFSITDDEAVAAVKRMKEGKGFFGPIFDRVQKALATLEGKVMNGPHIGERYDK